MTKYDAQHMVHPSSNVNDNSGSYHMLSTYINVSLWAKAFVRISPWLLSITLGSERLLAVCSMISIYWGNTLKLEFKYNLTIIFKLEFELLMI